MTKKGTCSVACSFFDATLKQQNYHIIDKKSNK